MFNPIRVGRVHFLLLICLQSFLRDCYVNNLLLLRFWFTRSAYFLSTLVILVSCGGCRISQRGANSWRECANLLFCKFFPENWIKMKELGRKGGLCPWHYPLNSPLVSFPVQQKKIYKCNTYVTGWSTPQTNRNPRHSNQAPQSDSPILRNISALVISSGWAHYLSSSVWFLF